MKNVIKNNFNRFAHSYNKYGVVQKEIAKRLFNKIDAINHCGNILELGAGTGFLTKFFLTKYDNNNIIATDFAINPLLHNPAKHKIVLDAHNISIDFNFDIIASNLMMQWCDNTTVIKQMIKHANTKCLVIFSTFGPSTLNELNKSFIGVDDNNHINNFVDMHDIADEMVKFGMSKVIAENEIITLTYQKVSDIFKDLKYIGAQNITPKPMNKAKLTKVINNYEKLKVNDKLPLSYEVIYINGWLNL